MQGGPVEAEADFGGAEQAKAKEASLVDLEKIAAITGNDLKLSRSIASASQVGEWHEYTTMKHGLRPSGGPPMVVAELPRDGKDFDIQITARLLWYDLRVQKDRHIQIGNVITDAVDANFAVRVFIEGEQLVAALHSVLAWQLHQTSPCRISVTNRLWSALSSELTRCYMGAQCLPLISTASSRHLSFSGCIAMYAQRCCAEMWLSAWNR